MRKTIGIVASSIYEGDEYRRAMSERDPVFWHKSVVIYRPEHIYGREYEEIHYVGRYYANEAYPAILEAIRYRQYGAKRVEVLEWR